MDVSDLYREFIASDGICIDSRLIQANQIFFALPGSQVDANQFAIQALKAGARKAIVYDQRVADLDVRCEYVADTIKTLQELARHHRSTLNIPILAITGSVGKTTTKELIAKVLNTQFKTFATKGNLNNHIGVPLSILSVTSKTEIAVIEMGANHVGEIEELCSMALPTHGLITRIGKAHIEGFGSLEGVIIAKSDLYRFIRNHKGTAFVNEEDPILSQVAKAFEMNKVMIHATTQAKLLAGKDTLNLTFNAGGKEFKVQSQVPGDYNYSNFVAAIAIGLFFNVHPDNIQSALVSYQSHSNRSQTLTIGTNQFLMDAYNANPLSMSSAIESFARQPSPLNKILILGEMRELGEVRTREHQLILDQITRNAWGAVYLVGETFASLNTNPDYLTFKDVNDLKIHLENHPVQNSYILLKASRGIALEKLIE